MTAVGNAVESRLDSLTGYHDMVEKIDGEFPDTDRCKSATRASPPTDERLDLQRETLKEAGCERIFEDTAGDASERQDLEQALAHLRARDTLVVWRLNKLGRSLKDPIARAEELRRECVGLKRLKEGIDIDSPTGQLVFPTFGALAEFERALIGERTQAGPQAARGRLDGRRMLTVNKGRFRKLDMA